MRMGNGNYHYRRRLDEIQGDLGRRADNGAAPLGQDCVTPDAMMAADAFAAADDAEATGKLQFQTDGVFRKRPALQSPDAVTLRCRDRGPQKTLADTLAARRACDIDTNLSNTGVNLSGRHRRQCRPAENAVFVSRCQP